jgi:hypothetical protein
MSNAVPSASAFANCAKSFVTGEGGKKGEK